MSAKNLHTAPATIARDDATELHDVPTYANLWDMVQGRTMSDEHEPCETLDFHLMQSLD
jgi:hypothetical protein